MRSMLASDVSRRQAAISSRARHSRSGSARGQCRELQAARQRRIFVGIDGWHRWHRRRRRSHQGSTPAAIDHLHQLGIKIIMLTGDNERTARAVAQKLGIDEVEAGVEPQHKA